MGREVKRVPLDFEWPLNEVWRGYLMPDSLRVPACEECGGRGTTPARDWVEQIAALALLLNTDLSSQAQGRPMHPYFHDTGSRASRRPTPDIAEFSIGLAGRGEPGRWHDSIDNWRATEKLIEAAGLDPKVWGVCRTCNGAGGIEAYEGQEAEAEAWEGTEPPEGPGYQLWETVSEGSPITPVFANPEELARYMTIHGWGASNPMASSFEVAMGFIDAGWAPSMVATREHGLESGVESVGRDVEWTAR
jgi:hypothetical protein